jgi:uncharacterized repeat protein (TIGR02543 family)
MLKTYDMRFRKVSAAGRAFWLWFVATALIVLSMAVSPNVAFAADEVQDIPEGVITFVDAGDTDSSPAVVEQEPVVASTSQEEIPEGVVTFDEPEAAEETQDASTNIPVGDPVVVEQEQTAPAQQEATNDQVASNENLQQGAEQQNAQENAPKQENADNGDKDELASNSSSNDNVQQAVDDEPAINPVQIDEEQAPVLDSNEPATQEPIITDAPANAPPTVDTASNANESKTASTNVSNSDNTQKAKVLVVASNGSSTSSASTNLLEYLKKLASASNASNLTAASTSFELSFQNYLSDMPQQMGTLDNNQWVALEITTNDPIFLDEAGTTKLTSSSATNLIKDFEDGEAFPTIYRTGYDLFAWVLYYPGMEGELNNDWAILQEEWGPDVLQGQAEIVYAVWSPTTFIIDVKGKSDQLIAIRQNASTDAAWTNDTVNTWSSSFQVPFGKDAIKSDGTVDTTKLNNTYYWEGINLDNFEIPAGYTFEGWMRESDAELLGLSTYDWAYTAKDGDWSKLIGSNVKFADVLSAETNGNTTLGKFSSNHIVLRPVFKLKTNDPISYKVTYTNVNAGGAASTTVQKTHGNQDGNEPETAIANPFENPSTLETGYSYKFIGWSKTRVAPSEAASPAYDYAVGASLDGVGGADTPAMNGNYTLYAVWKKIAQKYTVIYNSNVTSINAVTENNHLVKDANSENVKKLTELSWPTRDGYSFEGWATSSTGAATISAGTTLKTAFDPAADQTYSLWAVWKSLNYTVNFDYNGGTGPSTTSCTVAVGADKLPDGAPSKDTVTKQGYVFKGWKEGTTQVTDRDNNITSNPLANASASSIHDLVAIWEPIEYTINWYAKWNTPSGYTERQPISGASATSGPLSNASTTLAGLAAGDAISALTTPVEQIEGETKVTYTFSGWYISVTGSVWNAPATGKTPIGSLTIAQAFDTAGATTNLDVNSNAGTITIYGIWTSASSAKRTISFEKATSPTGGSDSVTKYQGEDYRIDKVPANVNGYTFTGWKQEPSGPIYTVENIKKSTDDSANTITNIQYNITLTGQWVPNTVQFKLTAAESDDTINLHKVKEEPQYVTATVGGTVKASDLSSGPTRDGFDFAGWRKSTGTNAIIGPTDADLQYEVLASDAPSNNEIITLVALWTPWTYTVKYHKNQSSDDMANSVKVYKRKYAGNWTSLGTEITTDPYVWTEEAKASDTGLNDPDIILTRDWYQDRNLVTWGLTSNSTTAISGTKTIGELYAEQQALDGRTNRVVDLYAIWVPIQYTVRYKAKNDKGTVAPTVETINLAKLDSVVLGSTATVTAEGYDLAVPTWTDNNGAVVDNCSESVKQATYTPTVKYLRSLYEAVPSSTECTFYANFTEKKYKYTIQAFMQKDDGSWNSVFTEPNDIEITTPGNTTLEANFESTVNASDTISGTENTAINGRPLYDIVLYGMDTDGVLNRYLYDYDTSQGKQTIASISKTESENILKLYYKRKTFNLVAEFKTKDENNIVTNAAPTGFTSVVTDFVNAGAATTSLPWGKSIKLTLPSAAGYTFTWALTSPSGSTSTIVQPTASSDGSLVLNAADMYKLISAAASTDAVLTGTFKIVSYKITLTDAPPSTGFWKDGDATARSQLASSGTTFTYVPSNKNISTWLPSADDRDGTKYYLAGWRDVEDSLNTVIAPDVLRSMTNWTKDTSFIAVWLPKVVVTYSPGDPDSYGNSKAAWVAHTRSLTDATDYSKVLLSSTSAKFATLVDSVDGDNNPLGAPGWEFDYWTIDGTDGAAYGYLTNDRYGHAQAYTGTNANAGGWFLDGANAPVVNGNQRDGILLSCSLTFIAHWKPVEQTVIVNNVGPVVNNTANENNVTATLRDPGKTYYTDDLVDMSDYAPTVIPNGYELVGWDWVFIDKSGARTSGTYTDKNATFHVKHGTSTTLTPRFNEKTVTFKYEIASTSNGRGTIDGTATDTVFVVTHNGITSHEAKSSNNDAFGFIDWTYNSSRVTTDAVLTAAKMTDIVNGDVLEGDRTYYANFSSIQYKITFDPKGTDGTTDMGSVSVSGTGADAMNNRFSVDWNDTIKGAVNITIPEGYELDGWIIDNAGDPQVFSGGDAANSQGIYNYKVTKNVRMTAHFKMSSQQNYTVKYNYDPDTTSGFSGTEASRSVAWGESVLPLVSTNANPVKDGFKFLGWYIDQARTKAITGETPNFDSTEFGKIYTYLGTSGATAPNYDSSTKSITIYGKWEPKTFILTYDLYGRDSYGNALPYNASAQDNVVKAIANIDDAKTDIAWTKKASEFKLTSSNDTFRRPGYMLAGWYATYENGSGTVVESYSSVGNETYGELAGGAEENAPVTLHAIWTPQNCTVQYIYNNSFAAGGGTTAKSATKGWTEPTDYYTLGFTLAGINPTDYADYKFNGWKVEWTSSVGTVHTETGTTQDAPLTTTIRDLVNGDITALDSSTVVWLKAIWVQQSQYRFQDRLVHLDGTEADRDVTSYTPIDGNTTVKFEKYGTPKSDGYYSGYDFDNHTATNTNHPNYTQREILVEAGKSLDYYVYYLERSYSIDFFLEPPTSSSAVGDYRTNNNAWDSAAAQLPSLPVGQPKKGGYTFDGWYLTTTNDPGDGVKLDGTKSIFATGVYSTAPANKSTLKAIAKWIADTVTIEWAAAANGTTNPAPGSVTIGATDANPFNASGATYIEAVPTSGGDYIFDYWEYEYTDPDDTVTPTKTGKVTASSRFAALSGTDGEKLTPVRWEMHTGEGAVWHNIKFTAHFALSSALSVTINYYYENGDKLDQDVDVRYEFDHAETKRDAEHGANYALTPTIPAGYALNDGLTMSKDSAVTVNDGVVYKKYDFTDPASQVINVYLQALKYTVTYKYTLSDGTTVQTASTNPALPASVEPLTNFNNGDFVTGQTHTVSAAPTLEGYEFKGWYFSDAYGTPIAATFSMPAKNVTIVGTWIVKNHTVHFINAGSSDPAVMAGCTVSEADGGYTVQYGSKVKTATNPGADAETLTALGVNYSKDKPYVLTGWDILIGGIKQNTEPIGESDPLQYVVKSDVTFRAVWSPTYAVTYTRGAHGNFTDKVNTTKTFVEYSSLVKDVALPTYEAGGTLDSNNKPNAVDGWEWVGWGVKDAGGTWTYYFANADYIDYGNGTVSNPYGSPNGTNVTAGLPATVTSNIEFVGFYKALERTLIFSMHQYKSGVAAGTESDKTFADDPQPTPASGVDTSYTVRTGQYPTMLTAAQIEREGYTLMGWTDGSKTYSPGSKGEFIMPDGPTAQYVYLYPVFDFAKVEITYAVDSEQTSWGDLDNTSDTLNNPGDPLKGSKPTAKPGYEFDYWTKGSDTTHLTSTDGLQSDDKLVPTGATGTVTFVAHFKQKTYDLAYAHFLGLADAQETLPTPALPTDQVWTANVTLGTPTRAGYTFGGWNVYKTSEWTAYAADPNNIAQPTALHTGVAAGATTVSALSNADGTATQLTLVPTWTAKSYKVIFDDGKTTGTGTVSGMPTPNPRDCAYDSEDINAAKPAREGYEFAGWRNSVKGNLISADSDTKLKYYELVNGESDTEVTLTAEWTPNSHTLTYQKVEGKDTWSSDSSKYPAGDPIFEGTSSNADAAINTATDATINLRLATSISRTGAKLLGWKHGDTEYRFASGMTFVMPDADVILTPIWEEFGDYNVYFLPGADAGEVQELPSDRKDIAYSTSNINMSAPKRPGWTFNGWDSSVAAVPHPEAGTGKKYADLVNNDDTIKTVTLTATWIQATDYQVKFNKNASETVTNMPEDMSGLKWGDTVYTLDLSGYAPDRPGYLFKGWIIKDNNGTALGNTENVHFNAATALFSELAQGEDKSERKILTLVAVWEAKTFTVEFVENKPTGASGTVTGMPATNPITGLQFDATGIVAPTLSLDGYQFKGWVNSVNNSVIAAGTYTYKELSGNDDNKIKVTLTAKWEANPHTVTYSIVLPPTGSDEWSTTPGDYPVSEPAANGANNPTAAISSQTDATIDLRGVKTAKRPGWTLKGWKDGDVEYLFAEGKVTYKVPDRDVTLTPIFVEDEDYNVFFFTGDSAGITKVDTSTMPANQTNIKYSATNINTAKPTRHGYIFMGWSNDVGADLGDSVTSESYAKLAGFDYTKKTVNLTAKWNKDESYNVHYESGVPSTSSVPFTGTLPTDLTNIGFDDLVARTELNASGTERIGFTFDGWKVTDDATGDVLATYTSASDYATSIEYSTIVGGASKYGIKSITFTAMWSGSPFQVTYHLTDGSWVTANITDAGKSNPDQPLTYKCEQSVPLRLANTVKRDGYVLSGWANGTNNLAADYVAYLFTDAVEFSMPAHDVDLYPVWDPKIYSVDFAEKPYNDTGSKPVDASTMPRPQTGEYNDTFTYAAPKRAGYDFIGWDLYKTDEYTADPATASLLKHVGEGSGTYAALAGSPDIDGITMVAIWAPMKVGVTYVLELADNATWVTENIKDAGKNSPNMLVSYETDEIVNLREADTVSRKGYVLIGWKEDNSPSVDTPKYPFDADGHASLKMDDTNIVLYAVWREKDGYTVKFEACTPTTNVVPGAVVEGMPADQPIAPNKLTWDGPTGFVDTQSPTFAGYEFKGWEVYDSNGVKISTSLFDGPGYHFYLLAGNSDVPAREHLTLKAVWDLALIYNVYFKDGVDTGDTPVTSGTMPVDQTSISYMATVDYHAPSRVGYTFDGWDVLDITDPNDEQTMPTIAAADAGSSPYYELAGNNVARKKLQLTARWIEKGGYNVHFVDKPESDTGATPVNMGSLSDYIDIHWDDAVIAYPAPTRTGYDFQHWAVTDTTNADDPINLGKATAGSYTYSKLARERTDDTIMDITLTAIWKAHEWTVTYVNSSDKGPGTWVKANIGDAGKNTPDAPVTYAVDDTITLRDRTTLVMSGYKLVGWQDDEVAPTNTYMLDTVTEFFMPDHDVNLYPIWAPKVYTVIFDGNKPSEATDASQVVTNLPPTQWAEGDAGYPLAWNGDVDTHAPTLAGYSFKGWVIEDASTTGARTGLLNGATYKFSELALTDIIEHETLKLIAQWEPAKYRVNYVDPIDATGAAAATPAMIATDATKFWGDIVSDSDPWTISNPAYAGKSNDDWQFLGWMVFDVNTNTYVALNTIANHAYNALATYENLTLADSATADETPALVLYASWARRVPFVVDFMKRDASGNDTVESSETLVGLDGQIIETTVVDELGKTWKAYILNTVGPNHGIPGYKYNATLSDPFVVGTLNAKDAEPLHVKLIYTELADYEIVYDAAPGASVSDPTRHTSTKGSLKWEDTGSSFVPNDSEWAYVGHKIVGWTYGPTGVEFDFDPSVKFSAIAEAIYGTVDGAEGRDIDGDGTVEKPVTLFAKWAERTDYKVKYDDNYAVDDGKVKSGITDGRFLERVADATYTPATKEDVAWSATEIEPTETDKIKKPGVKDGIELYTIDGWNYLSKDGVQKPAEGLSFAQIVADMFDGEPTDNEITLYARYKEIAIEIKYTPVLSDDDGNVISTGASAAGTVSISLETPDAVTGTIQGSTATPNRGYHFVGWRRASDGEILLLNASGTLSGMASKIGYNVLPDGLGGATLLLAAQNTDDGYWHEEEYYALFAQNEMAILHYDKNAEDATGSIPDVEAPYETLIDLSDGSGFKRTYWTLVSWNTKPDGTGTTYALSQKDWEMPKGETTLYAQWVRNKVKLTYEPGGPDVTGIPEGVEDEWGTKHPVSDQQPKRDHYTFKGWNTKEDGTGIWWKPGDEIELPGDGIHLYAQWEINKYPVSIDPGPYTGGKVTYPDDGTYVVEHGGHLPEGYVTATPEPGYHITGWHYTMTDEYGNVTTGIVSDPTELVVIGKVTFSAIFEADPVDEPMAPYEGYSGNGGLTPQTGDMNLVLVLAISGMAAMTLLLLIVAARRRRKEE